jgi:DNA end-binding protein Ku
LWKGNISFALLNIPVKLYGASHKKDLSFHLLHKKCSTPLHYERYCPTCKADVAWDDTVHGYEYKKEKFVVVTDEEIEHIPITTSKSIDILRFIDQREIESIYYDKAYYLEPVEGGERAYALLRETMKESGKVALAKITFKNREHVTVIRVNHDALLLQTLLYTEDIVKLETLDIPKKIALDNKELALATELVRHFLGKFNIDSYHDEFGDSLLELIKAKIAGKEIKVAPKREAEKVISLMDAL